MDNRQGTSDCVLYLNGVVFASVEGASLEDALSRYGEFRGLEVIPREEAGEQDWETGLRLERKRMGRYHAIDCAVG